MGKGVLSEIKKSAFWTTGLTLLFVLFNLKSGNTRDLLVALPFFIVLYFLIFSVGRELVTKQIRNWINNDIKKAVIFPAAMVIIYIVYIILTGENPLKGVNALLPYLVFFPVLVFAARNKNDKDIDWLDFATFVIFLLPITLINAKPSGNLPVKGNEFDSIYRIMMMLVAVYAFAAVRGIDNIGFFPEFKLKKLFTAIWVWLAFYGTVFMIGYSVSFIQLAGYKIYGFELILKILLVVLTTFLHTALFEELFFRGILQNMLAKRINRAKTWTVFWKWGFGILLILSILVGYTLHGKMQWFPALVTVIMFLVAFYIERSGVFEKGIYVSLAITGVLFGLVHYHSGSIIYIGFASIAGWAYGYTWIKTKNVFYAALVHALVGSSNLIFGLELLK